MHWEKTFRPELEKCLKWHEIWEMVKMQKREKKRGEKSKLLKLGELPRNHVSGGWWSMDRWTDETKVTTAKNLEWRDQCQCKPRKKTNVAFTRKVNPSGKVRPQITGCWTWTCVLTDSILGRIKGIKLLCADPEKVRRPEVTLVWFPAEVNLPWVLMIRFWDNRTVDHSRFISSEPSVDANVAKSQENKTRILGSIVSRLASPTAHWRNWR